MNISVESAIASMKGGFCTNFGFSSDVEFIKYVRSCDENRKRMNKEKMSEESKAMIMFGPVFPCSGSVDQNNAHRFSNETNEMIAIRSLCSSDDRILQRRDSYGWPDSQR